MNYSFFPRIANRFYVIFLLQACDENDKGSDEDLQWEDNWDDEAEGEDNFTKRLREELAQEG